MRRFRFVFALPAVVLFVNLSMAQITIDIQSGNVAKPQQAASLQPSQKLTDQDIIDMAALKLSDDVIIDKIHRAEAIDFDTSVAGLRLLKASNVSDAVLRAILNPHAITAGTSNDAAAQPSNPYAGLGDGIYLVLAGKPIEVPVESFAWYVGRGKMTGRVKNSHSQFQVSNPLEFIVVRHIGGAGLLFRLEEKNDHREFRVGPHLTVDWRGKLEWRKLGNQIYFEPEPIASYTSRIRLQILSNGEYGFQWVEPTDFVQNGSIQQFHICTFSVIH